jgi:DNA ligase-1
MTLTIKKPLLARNFDPSVAKYPYLATPKIDGIRFLMVNGVAVSKTFKPIRNRYIQELLSSHLPDGIDGELTSGDTFQSSTSAVMTIEGTPEFKVWIFDYVDPENETILPFKHRLFRMPTIPPAPFEYEILHGSLKNSLQEVEDYEKICLLKGYEGVMLRDPEGTYKFGRSTVRDNILLKVKRFLDDEAELIDIEEMMSNQNPEERDAFGNVKRSSALDGMVPTGVTGKLICRKEDGKIIRVGSGLDDYLRQEIWEDKEQYIGKIVKYKYFPQGVKELPRHPVFLGFRDLEDL